MDNNNNTNKKHIDFAKELLRDTHRAIGGIYQLGCLVDSDPKNVDIAYKIMDKCLSEKNAFNPTYSTIYHLSYSFGGDDVYPLLEKMIRKEYNDEKFNKLMITYLQGTIEKFSSSLTADDKRDADRILHSRKENFGNKTFETYSNRFSEFDPRKLLVLLAAHNVKSPETVEACRKMCDTSEYYQELMYHSLIAAGYKANGFEEEYIQKLNNKDFIFQKCHVSSYADNLRLMEKTPAVFAINHHTKLNTDVLVYLAERNPSILADIADNRLEGEAIAKAKAEKNPPSHIFIEEYDDAPYGTWAERVYIKNEKGDYIPTNIVDDLYFENGDSAREFMKCCGNLVSTGRSIFHRDDKDSDFKLLENTDGYRYFVLDNDTYWRHPTETDTGLYHRGGNEGSVLVSKNPVTGKFEDVACDDIERFHGNYVEGLREDEDGNLKKVMYKRDQVDGKFYPDVEFPYGECIYAESIGEDDISISFLTDDGTTYVYEGTSTGSCLEKHKGRKKEIIYRSSPLQEQKNQKAQRDFENGVKLSPEELAAAKRRIKERMAEKKTTDNEQRPTETTEKEKESLALMIRNRRTRGGAGK